MLKIIALPQSSIPWNHEGFLKDLKIISICVCNPIVSHVYLWFEITIIVLPFYYYFFLRGVGEANYT